MATKGADIFDVPDAGQSGEFALCRAGGGLYFAVIANGGDGGRLMLRRVGGGLAQDINLGPLGVTGALSVRLDGAGGTLVAYIKRVIDTDGQDRGRRVITPIDTGIPVGEGGDTPATPPAPPGATVDLSAVLRAIEAARGPLDGKDAEFNTTASVKNTANAIYDRLGIGAGDATVADRVDGLRLMVGALAGGGAAPHWRAQAWDDNGLPPELAQTLGLQIQRDIIVAVVTFLEYALRLPAFPRADGGTILRT